MADTQRGLVSASQTRSGRSTAVLAAAAAASLAWLQPTSADVTWNGANPGADNWTLADNWVGGVAPVPTVDALFFDGSTRLTPLNDFAADSAFNGLTFNGGAGSFNLGGNQITLNGNLTNNAAVAQTVGIGLVLNAPSTFTSNPGATTNFTGVVSGTNAPGSIGLTLTGGGTFNFSAANTYSGNIAITGNSTVNVTGAGDLGDAASNVYVGYLTAGTLETSTLNLSDTSSVTANNLYIHYNQVQSTASSTNGPVLNVNGNNTINATNIIVSAGRNGGNTKGGLGRLTVNAGGTLTLRGASGSGPVTLLDVGNYSFETGGGTTAGTDGVVDFSAGTVNGDVTTINLGTGKPGTATNNGGTANGTMIFKNGALNAGTINLGRVGRQPATGTLTLAAGGTGVLAVGAGGITFGAQGAPIGTIATSGTVNVNGATLSLGGNIVNVKASAANTTGAVNIAGGTLDMNNFSIGTDTNLVTVNATSGTIRDVGTINTSGGLTKSGTGTLIVEGTNGWTGGTTVTGGTLAVTGSLLAGGNVNVNGGFLGGTSAVIGNVSVNGGRVRPGTVAGDISALTLDTLAVHTGGLHIDLGPGFTSDKVNVTGALTLGDTAESALTLGISGAPSIGSYEILNYTPGSLTNNANFSFSGPLGFNYALNYDTAGKVFLNVSAGNTLYVWNGATDGTTWDLSTPNFSSNGSDAAFTNGSDVVFDDSASAAATAITLTADVTPGQVAVLGDTNNYTFQGSGIMVGSGTLAKEGSSTLTILNNNTNSGRTTIRAGTIQVGNGGATGQLGSGVIENNATLRYNRSDNVDLTNIVTGTGTLSQVGAGTLSLSGANSYGSTEIGAGSTLSVGSGGTSGTLGTGPVANAGTLLVNRSNAVTIGNVISGAGGLRKLGTGTATMSGASTYTGVTTISGGVLTTTTLPNIGAASGIGAGAGTGGNNSASIVIEGATLRWAGAADQTSNRGFTLTTAGGTIDSSPTNPAGGAALNLNGAGSVGFIGSGARTLTLSGTEPAPLTTDTNSISLIITDEASGPTSIVKNGNNRWQLGGANTYTGGTQINSGGIRLSNVQGFGAGPVNVANGAQAYINVGGTIGTPFTIAGNGPDEQPVLTDPISGFGALRIANANAILAGTITLAGDARITGRSGGAGGYIGGNIVETGGARSLEFGNSGAAGGALFIAGSANSWSGTTTISHGTLKGAGHNTLPSGAGRGNVVINNSSATVDSILDLNGTNQQINGLTSSGADLTRAKVLNDGGGAATLTVGAGDANASYGGVLSDGVAQLAVTKIGAGTQTLAGTNSYTGATTVSAGTLEFTQSMIGPSTMTVNGTGTLRMAPDSSSTLKTPSITITDNGVLAMNNNDFIVDYDGDSPEFQLRDYVKAFRDNPAATSGISYARGANDQVIAVAEKIEWSTTRTEFNGIEVDSTTIIGKHTYYGDANLDGKVDSNDYVAVDVGLGQGDSWVQGDFNFSGTVTSDDYVAIDTNLGKGVTIGDPLAIAELKAEMIALHTAQFGDEYVQALAIAEEFGYGALVPEPGTLSLVGLGAAGLLGRRRRRST